MRICNNTIFGLNLTTLQSTLVMNRFNFLLLLQFIFLLFIYVNFTANCSAQNVWLGGFVCNPNNWNTPANWSLHHVPDEWDVVVIPNTETTTRHYPTINTDAGTIKQLILGYNAYVNVTSLGRLTIELATESTKTNTVCSTVFENTILNQELFDKTIYSANKIQPLSSFDSTLIRSY
jgi:hypothetical protein